MVKKSFALVVDGKTYQVKVLRAGVISVDGQVYDVAVNDDGVQVNGDVLAASLSEGFAIVSGKLYETEWSVG